MYTEPEPYSGPRLEMNEYILNALIGCQFLYVQLLDISESKVKCAKLRAGVGVGVRTGSTMHRAEGCGTGPYTNMAWNANDEHFLLGRIVGAQMGLDQG